MNDMNFKEMWSAGEIISWNNISALKLLQLAWGAGFHLTDREGDASSPSYRLTAQAGTHIPLNNEIHFTHLLRH